MPRRHRNRLQLLYLAADRSGAELLRRVGAIAIRTGAFELVARWAVGTDNLEAEISRVSPDMIHVADSGADGSGPYGPQWRTALIETLAAAERPPLVILDGSATASWGRALGERASAVVAIEGELEASARDRFASGFYRGLVGGLTVSEAFESARGELSETERSAPVLCLGSADSAALRPVRRARALPPAEELAPPPIFTFCSYAHEDERYREDLEEHLALLRRLGMIQVWMDREIRPGAAWTTEIAKALETADLVLLLISPSFIASDFIWEKEMKPALDRRSRGEAQVVPVLIRSGDYRDAPFMGLQVLPREAKPVDEWESPDLAWKSVVEGIRDLVESLRRGA